MKLNDYDLGVYNPIRKTDQGQMIGDAEVVSQYEVPYARGGTERVMTVRHWVSAPVAIGGSAAGSAAATELLCVQLEELSMNSELSPCLIRWSSVRSTPHDGWWHVRRASPDYSWYGSTYVPVDFECVQRAPATAPRHVWYAGGALASAYTAAAANLVAGPVNSQGSFDRMRQSSEGGVPFVLGPGLNPVPFAQSQNLEDEFKGRCRVFDVGAQVSGTPPGGAGNPPNANWLEVFDPHHKYGGDLVLSNGLAMVSVSIAQQSVTAWCWDPTALLWRQAGNLVFRDATGAVMAPRTARLVRLSPDEVVLDVYLSNGQGMLATLTLQRGQRPVRLQLRPRTFSNALPWLLTWLPSNGARVLVYNSGGIADQGVASDPVRLAPTADAGWAAILLPSAGYPILAALHWQSPPADQPRWPASPPGGVYLGDTAGPAQNAMSTYWLSMTPFTPVASLQAEGESGTLGAGWSSVADALASAGNAAKAASGTLTGNDDMLSAAYVPLAGNYDVWFRVRVTSAAGAAAEMQLGLWDSTLGAWIGSTTYRANQASTGYVWLRAAQVTMTTASRPRLRALTTATLGTDWFVDEAVTAPTGGLLASDGPAELWQQAMYARTTDMGF